MDNTSNWRTRVDPALSTPYGVDEVHGVFFQPISDRGGVAPTIMVQIPETPMAAVRLGMAYARKRKARVGFLCDTPEQARDIADRVMRLLPRHKRISYERAAAGAWGMAQ
jgi:hypothetical protein